MNYQKALKQVQNQSVKPPFVLITLDYNTKLVVPHKDALTLLGALANAEQLHDPYGKSPHIMGIAKDKLQFQVMSRDMYEHYKIAALLNIPFDDLGNLEKNPPS